MNKDQVKGRAKAASGKAKEVTGKLVFSKKLEAKGRAEGIAGKARSGYGDAKNRVKKSS